MIRDYQAIQKTWFIKGKQKVIPTYGKNAGVKLIQPFLNEVKDRLELMFLPPYSPEFNLIEGLWGWIKSSVINNRFFLSIVKLELLSKSL